MYHQILGMCNDRCNHGDVTIYEALTVISTKSLI
jgi:hypothetical protein